jgi:ABC-2 type transport system permease protein
MRYPSGMRSDVAVSIQQRSAGMPEKLWAIVVRDARLAMSYSYSFWLQWFNIAVEVAILFFISSLVAPSASFSPTGQVLSYFNYIVINFAFLRFQNAALNIFAETIRDGQTQGTLEVILATPTGLPVIVLSSGVWAFTITCLQAVVFVAVATLFGFQASHLHVATALGFVILTMAAFSPLGVMVSAFTILFKKTGPLVVMIQSAAALFGGVYLPVSRLPHWAQIISWWMPITHALAGLRGAFEGASIGALKYDALWLIGFTGVFLPLSLLVFAKAVQNAKREGSLAHT